MLFMCHLNAAHNLSLALTLLILHQSRNDEVSSLALSEEKRQETIIAQTVFYSLFSVGWVDKI